MARVLFVEDDFSLRLSLAASLRGAGHEVAAVASAEEAREAASRAAPEVAILDWNLPGESGVSLLRAWRAAGAGFPVIVVTARDAVGDRVEGLDAGANDYIVKPFATEELLARVRVQLRARAAAAEPEALRTVALSSGARVDLARETVERGGRTARLTTQEALLLAYLAARPGRAVSRAELLKEVWGFRTGAVETRAVDNTVLRLRAKIEADPASPRHVLTVHGTGYRFEP